MVKEITKVICESAQPFAKHIGKEEQSIRLEGCKIEGLTKEELKTNEISLKIKKFPFSIGVD